MVEIIKGIIKRGDLKVKEGEGEGEVKARVIVADWWRERIKEAVEKMVQLVEGTMEQQLAEMSLVAVMRIIKEREGNKDGERQQWGKEEKEGLNGLLRALCSEKRCRKGNIQRFREFVEYPDVRQHTVQAMGRMVKKIKKEKITAQFKSNFMSLLEIIDLSSEEDEDPGESFLCHGSDGETGYIYPQEAVKRSYSELWECFLKLPLDNEIYKRVLLILDEKVMPHLARPLLLTDFLINSYNVGGSVSILALNGVFTLIQKYNLEYPDFYKKLYALFQPEVLHAKYRARFLYMADIFMTSSHLPEYLVAAVAKRLSRLALTAPANAMLAVFPFVGNLILRHKGLAKMLHGEGVTAESDPYVHDEPDPANCRASESVLWELHALKSHALPQVSAAAIKLVSKKLPEMEWDLSEYLEVSMEDMMKTEAKKKIFLNVPLTFERPRGFKAPKNSDIMSKCFEM